MISKVVGLYFSPSGETAKIIRRIATEITDKINDVCIDEVSCEYIDMLRQPLRNDLQFGDDTIAVIGMPVFNGRIPALCTQMLERIHANGSMAVAVVSYGNRSYGDSLYELYSTVEEQGFSVMSAAAFVAQNSLFGKVAHSRPDALDLKHLIDFCELSANKMKRFCGTDISYMKGRPAPLNIKGSRPSKKPLRIPIHPSVNGYCIHCGKCAEICPTGAIDRRDPSKVDTKRCISCTACMNACEQDARGFHGPMSAATRLAFEHLYNKRKDPEWFL